MGLLNKERLLTKSTLGIEKVHLTDKDYVFVREMTGRERDHFEKLILEAVEKDGVTTYERKFEDFRAKLATMTACDEKGELLLGMDDVETLSTSMPASQLEKIVNVAQRLNKMETGAKETLSKNLGAGDKPGNSSASASN